MKLTLNFVSYFLLMTFFITYLLGNIFQEEILILLAIFVMITFITFYTACLVFYSSAERSFLVSYTYRDNEQIKVCNSTYKSKYFSVKEFTTSLNILSDVAIISVFELTENEYNN